MEIKYKIFEKLKAENILVKDFKENMQFGNSMISKLQHNKNVTLETIGKICEYLQCPIEDVVEIQYTTNSITKIKQKLELEKAELENQLKEIQTKLDSLQ